jgi:alpha-1,2-mannosyltransferase
MESGGATREISAADKACRDVEGSGPISPWVHRAGPAILVAALLLYLVVYLRWPELFTQVDLLVYRFGAERVRNGLDLYSVGLTGNARELLFIYPPFAALCFVPLTFVNKVSVEILSLLAAFALVTYAVQRMLRSLGCTRPAELWSLTALLVGLVAWVEPIRLSVQLGQINLVILAVVLADLLGPKQRKWAGIGVGLVAGIKLTPAIFILYLVVIGRVRAALVAAATLVATIVVGFAVLPTDSTYYWFNGGFDDVGRISHDPLANTSLRGLVLRLDYPAALATVGVIALVVASLALAAAAYRRGHVVLAIAVVGMASAAASPFSWSHHWVWFAPLVVHLGYRAYALRRRWSAWSMWLFFALFASWFTSFVGTSPNAGVLALRPGGVWGAIIAGTYVLALIAVLVCTWSWLWRADPVAEPADRPLTRVSRV